MARIAGTNVSYGNQDLHQRIADEDLAMSMPLGRMVETDNQLLSRLANQRQAQVGRGFGVTPQQPTIAQSQGQVFNDYSAILQAQKNVERQQADQLAAAQRMMDAARQIERRMDQTGYPGLDALGNMFLRQQANVLASGGMPVFGDGQYQGVVKDGRYSGNLLFDPNRDKFFQEDNQREVVLPVTDQETGVKRCPDGYIFDEQLQACRLDTTMPNTPQTAQQDVFYQQPYQSMSLLDDDGYQYGVPLIYG